MHVFSCCVRDELRVGDSVGITILDILEDHIRVEIRTPGQEPEYQLETIYLAESQEPHPEEAACAAGRLVEI